MVVDDGLGYQECSTGIVGGDFDIDEVRFLDEGGGDGAVEGIGADLCENVLAQEAAVEQLLKNTCQGGGGGKAAVHRRGAAPGSDHVGGGGGIDGGIAQVRTDVGGDAHQHGGQDDDQPALADILHHDDGVETQQTVILAGVGALLIAMILMFHDISPPQRRSAGRYR